MDEVRVLMVADDPLARAGLAALLADRVQVVGQTDSADLALDVYRPDVVLWDLGWDPDAASDAVPDALSDLGD
ncbi:MAG: hypothetical protein GYB65_09490, partial [Chloroflexi bacterium]|nr:hypothetical protein [Chloroflexota bacterium]